ncbi:hypothetical protein VCSRO69_3614 [Vibrio cholerae]|nr:hypothetical protein VCSRO69_3614 [Vibrio cholerae]
MLSRFFVFLVFLWFLILGLDLMKMNLNNWKK